MFREIHGHVKRISNCVSFYNPNFILLLRLQNKGLSAKMKPLTSYHNIFQKIDLRNHNNAVFKLTAIQ